MPRFDQSFTGLCEQNLQDTLQLKQRYLDAKAKRVPKSKDKKQQEQIQSSVHVQQKFLKRAADEHEPGAGSAEPFEPPVKLQCTAQQNHQNEGLTKFSVEIVQQLEFTTSAANSQPQQISTNVTVKAHTNASVKSDVSSPKSNPSTPASKIGLDVGTLVECVKQEPDNDFADLDQCAAALEKDAQANGGAAFGNFSDLIGDDTNDEIITSDAFNDLISDISNYPELMKDFDFEEKPSDNLKVEENKEQEVKTTPQVQNQNYSPPVFENQVKNRMVYPNLDFAKNELSPAAQTLKQMAEQHQHKNQMNLSYNPAGRVPNSRSPYSDFQFDYGSPNSNFGHKNNPGFTQPDLIKQEMFQGDFDMKRKGTPGLYKQQYSPYSSPSASSHGSPGNSYLSRGGANPNATPTGQPYGGGTPPRPPSGHGGNSNNGTTLSINQAQQLHITQQSHGHNIQVSAGQHLQLSGDLKGNVSIATHQGMHFNQHTTSNTNGNTQQPNTNQNSQSNNQQMGSNNNNPGTNSHNVNMNQQQTQSGVPPMGNTMMNNGQPQMQGAQMRNPSGNMGNSMQGGNSGIPDMSGPEMQVPGSVPGSGNIPGSGSMPGMGSMTGGVQGGMGNLNGGTMIAGPPIQHSGGLDSYSMSQTQTINFTQQTLRQRTNGQPGMNANQTMAGNQMGQNAMGNRMMGNPQTMEQQKLLQQQQMLRAQQAAAMQQHLVRPPPPDYKTSAGMMQPRYPPNMNRRMAHQPMPPSGPMMRPHNIYMQQQQMMASRNMYPRQQAPMSQMEPMQHGNSEWRHLLMSQQNSNFNPSMRPNFQQGGFNMGSNTIQMSAMQHQQMRSSQGMPGNMAPTQQGMPQNMVQNQMMNQGNNPLNQMGNMNQQMLNQMQQQNLMQQNAQMSMSSLHLQQSQSMSIGNQSMQHQNNQLVNNPSNNSLNNFNPQAADFSLEFLDNIAAPDSGALTDQELLISFDTDSGFNLDF